jgi:dTDP-4-dehydrorhamnose 3,5-epimerase
MKFIETNISGVMVIDPTIFEDHRGFFLETYHKEKFQKEGVSCEFVQDNHSKSEKGTLRGLHFQLPPKSQAKLVKVIKGEIFDVGVDLRKDSPTFGKWFGVKLSEENRKMLYLPGYIAHGFYVLSETAEVTYKCSDLYAPELERSILWNDPDINIDWPIPDGAQPIISDKDLNAENFDSIKSSLTV